MRRMERADRDEGSGASERVSHRGSGIRAMLNNLEVFSINHEAAGKNYEHKELLENYSIQVVVPGIPSLMYPDWCKVTSI